MDRAQLRKRMKNLAADMAAMEAAGEIPAGWAKDLACAFLSVMFQGERPGAAFD